MTLKALLALLLLSAACGPALAQPALSGPAPAAAVLDDGALASVRGGYVSADGLAFDFAAQVSTYVDDKLVLQSRLRLNDGALSSEQTGVGAGLPFVSIPGEGGDTRVMQILDPGRIGNLVLNTASNRDIRQDTTLTLVIPGLADLQGEIGLQRLGAQLNAAAASGTMSRLGR